MSIGLGNDIVIGRHMGVRLSGGGEAAPLLLDTFTDTNGVLLDAHTPDIGGPWILLADTEIDIQSNRAQAKTVAGNQAVAVVDVGMADVVLQCDLAALFTNPSSVIVRATDESNYWMVRAVATPVNALEIYERNAGTFTIRATLDLGTVEVGAWYTLTVATKGDTIAAKVGDEWLTYDSSFNATATKHGLRAREITTNQWDDISINRTGNSQPWLFKLSSHSPSALSAARDTLIDLIWRTEGELPSAGVDSAEADVTDPLTTSASNLAQVDKLTTDVGDATDRINYVWHPTNSNGKLVIYHYGHTSEDWNAGGQQVQFIHALIDAGYTVCGSQMPPGNVTGHNLYPAPDGSLNPLKFFLEDVHRCINELAGSYDAIYMAGLSGGAWTTVVCAALDTRIERNVHVDGDLPLFITQASRDYEQLLPGVYPQFDYTDLYVMASDNGRRQIQLLVEDSGLFDLDEYSTAPYAEAVVARVPSGGSYALVFDDSTTTHEISAYARQEILGFFDAV